MEDIDHFSPKIQISKIKTSSNIVPSVALERQDGQILGPIGNNVHFPVHSERIVRIRSFAPPKTYGNALYLTGGTKIVPVAHHIQEAFPDLGGKVYPIVGE